jgi:hypothetical protein
MKRLALLMLIAATLLAPMGMTLQSATAVNVFKETCDKYQNNPPQGEVPSACKDVKSQQNDLDSNPVVKIIRAAVNVISVLAGAAAIITIIVSGIRLALSRGDSNAAASARSGLITSLVGLAVIALAQVLVLIVVRATR